jgi:hypothetical protein
LAFVGCGGVAAVHGMNTHIHNPARRATPSRLETITTIPVDVLRTPGTSNGGIAAEQRQHDQWAQRQRDRRADQYGEQRLDQDAGLSIRGV